MWLPDYERYEYPGLAGKPYQFTHNPKGCMHTTEGGSIAGAMSAYAPYPPHLIYDWRNRRGVQHVRLDRAAYSAMDGNDDDYMIQVELVGFAAETRNWPEQALRNIAADVVAPLEQFFQIPRTVVWHGFKDGRDGITLATASSPIRLNWTQLRDFSGWLGHQHLPSPDTHWDPGALPMARIFSYLPAAESGGGKAAPALVPEEDMAYLVKGKDKPAVYVVSATADGTWKRHVTDDSEFNVLRALFGDPRVLNQFDVDRIPTRSATGTAVWNYGIPAGEPGKFDDAYKVVDSINRNTRPEATA